MNAATSPPLSQTAARVRFAETDQMGFFVGRVEYCRAAGIRYRNLDTTGGVLLTVEAPDVRRTMGIS